MPALLPAYHAASRGTRQPAAVLSSRQSFLWKKNLTPCAACARKLLTHRVCCGEVAQLGEHRLRKAGVEGSNPFFSTTNFQRARKLSACEPFFVAAIGGTSLPRSAGNNVFNFRKINFPLPYSSGQEAFVRFLPFFILMARPVVTKSILFFIVSISSAVRLFSLSTLAPNYGRIYGQKYIMSVKKFEPSRCNHTGRLAFGDTTGTMPERGKGYGGN